MDQTETPASGEAPIMRPLGAGDPAPTFMLPDPDDVMISSAELLENGPLVVTFYRGIWCPYCRQDLKHLANAAPDIRSCGASLVAIAHQTVPDSNGKFQREHGLEFPILDDRQGDVAVAYRIRWSPQELAAAEERLGKLPDLATETTWICRFRRATSSGAMASSSMPISMPTIGSVLIPVRSCRFCVRSAGPWLKSRGSVAKVVGEEIDERAGGRFYGIAVGIDSVRLDGSQVPGGKSADLAIKWRCRDPTRRITFDLPRSKTGKPASSTICCRPCTARATRCYSRGDVAHEPDLRSRHSGSAPLSRTRQCERQPLGGPTKRRSASSGAPRPAQVGCPPVHRLSELPRQ